MNQTVAIVLNVFLVLATVAMAFTPARKDPH